MKFHTHNDEVIETQGTSLRGHIQATRADLEKTFGNVVDFGPIDSEDKITTMWEIQFENGTVATIYDWKRYEEGAPKMHEVIAWHIGGNDRFVVELAHEAFREANELNARAA